MKSTHRRTWILAASLALMPAADGQMQTGDRMKNFNAVLGLGGARDFEAVLLEADAPGCIYFPGETPRMRFQLQNRTRLPRAERPRSWPGALAGSPGTSGGRRCSRSARCGASPSRRT